MAEQVAYDRASTPAPSMAAVSAKPASRRDAFAFGKSRERRRGSLSRISAGSSIAVSRELIAGQAGGSGYRPVQNLHWLNPLVPQVPAPPQDVVRPAAQLPWPQDARKLADSLLRRDAMKDIVGGIEMKFAYRNYPARRKDGWYTAAKTLVYSPRQWVAAARSDRGRSTVEWCDAQTRAILAPSILLGSTRAALPGDRRLSAARAFSYYNDHSMQSLADTYHAYVPELTPKEDDTVLLIVRARNNRTYEQRFLIDTRRRVLLRYESAPQGKVKSAITFDDFVEVAGCWWARKATWTDADGKRTAQTTLTVSGLDKEGFEERYAAALPGLKPAILLKQSWPTLGEAKQAQLDKKAGIGHTLVLIGHHARTQQWDTILELWKQAQGTLKGRPGEAWLTDAILRMCRRNEELSQRALDRAAAIVESPQEDDLYLASFLYNQGNGYLQANERSVFLDALRPVYDRQPARLLAGKDWQTSHAKLLQQVGRGEESIDVWQALVKQYPRDVNVRNQWFNTLVQHGDLDVALKEMKRLLARKDYWTEGQRNSVRSTVSNQLQNRAPSADWLAFLETWMAEGPAYAWTYQHYLTALFRVHKVEEAKQTLRAWIEEGIRGQVVDGEREAEANVRLMKLQAAVRAAMGQGHNMYSNQYDARWNDLLASVVKAMYRSEKDLNLANQVMSHHQFRVSKQATELRHYFRDAIVSEMAELNPHQVQQLVGWLFTADPALEEHTWRRIGSRLDDKWRGEKEVAPKHGLAQPLIQILRAHGKEGVLLDFLHRQIKDGPAEYRTAYVSQLFNELLTQRWNVEQEDELFALLGELTESTNTHERLSVLVPALYDLADRMVVARNAVALEDAPKKETLARTEYNALKKEKLGGAREAVIVRLTRELETQEDALRPWLILERLYLAVKQKHEARDVAAECWELLGSEPPDDSDSTLLGAHRVNRCLTTLACLAAKNTAATSFIEPLTRFIDRAITKNPATPYWQEQKYRLLVSLDRPVELEQTLRGWIKPGRADNTWRLALGYLMAELDRLPEAILQFEAILEADELGPKELTALADWYMARDDREKHEQTRIQALMAEQEHYLSQRLRGMLSPWYNNDETVPEELDPETFRIFTALFRKAQRPANYVHQLREFYRHTRDFRLLECLAEGVLGHTAQQAYPFMKNLNRLLDEVREEATVDTIVAHIRTVRPRAKTHVDRRALDFLELQAERRAAEVGNQPGPHVQAALGAMQRSFKGAWGVGERRQMADLLAGLGKINREELSREQRRQLRALHAHKEQPAQDRLHIAQRLAETLWAYNQRDAAIDTLEAALAEFRDLSSGVLPSSANSALARFVGYLSEARHAARAENYLHEELTRPANQQQIYWLKQRVFEVYTGAIAYKGTVSLGSGQALYGEVFTLYMRALETNDPNNRSQLINLICAFFRAAKNSGLQLEGMREFAFETFPEFLARETNQHNYHNHVSNLGQALHDVLGARTGLEFLIKNMEEEPEWVRANHQSGWQRHAYQMGRWRGEVKNLGELEPRLLAVVTSELRRDLRTRRQSHRYMYYRHNHYWAEKAAAFAAVADSVWKEMQPAAGPGKYIAQYVWRGLDHRARAIEILFEARAGDRLDEGGLSQLVGYLHHENRFEESIVLLQELIERRPDTLGYRTQLMKAYFKTDRGLKLRALLAATDTHFHNRDLWQENTIAGLAASCLETALHAESIAYYDEVIPLHKRTQPRRGIGNGTLSSYYANLSRAHAALKQTVEAVEAACGAIVSWGKNLDNRRNAVNALHNVLAQAQALDAYIQYLDKQIEASGLENPIVRQALGKVFIDRKQYEPAAHHLRLALEAQPNDRRTHELLVNIYDRMQDPEGAVRQLLQSVSLSRRDIALYKDLGGRYLRLEQPARAERAYTSIVEMLPNESEGHTMLAEIRQGQGEWQAAIHHWRQVARIRALEPTGLLKLAEAQIHEKLWGAATKTVDVLRAKDWPSRFGNVHNQAEQLKNRVEQ